MMKYFLHMAHGDLEDFYGGGISDLPFQAVFQGNEVGPAILLAISIVLMEMVCSHGHMATFTTPINCLSTSLLGLIYIDNCDLFAIDFDGQHPQTWLRNSAILIFGRVV